MVSDMGPTNRTLWNTLNINTESTSFKNPFNDKNVYVFADVPHLIKLARNHLLDHGFVYDNKYIGKETLVKFLSVHCTEINLAYKINQSHLDVTGAQRQNVRLAAQVFSDRLSKAIEFCGKAKMLDHISNWQEVTIIYSLYLVDLLNVVSTDVLMFLLFR